MAQELAKALETHGIDAWVDFKNLRPGQRWKDELEHAIAEARWLLILVGSGSRSTASQETEWSAALARSWADKEKCLVPVVFGESELPAFLRNWVPLRIDPDENPATWTRHVLDALPSLPNGLGQHLNRRSRRELQQRLDEIGKMAEELREEGDPRTKGEARPQ
jgi:hypothetical protein